MKIIDTEPNDIRWWTWWDIPKALGKKFKKSTYSHKDLVILYIEDMLQNDAEAVNDGNLIDRGGLYHIMCMVVVSMELEIW